LAHASDPALVFIYGWNEPFEGSMAFPTQLWGDTKARLVQHFIERLASTTECRLPGAIVVVDDLAEKWSGRADDWHFDVLRQMLLYQLRLFVPQANVVTPAEVTTALLEAHELIVDLTVIKSASFIEMIQLERARGKHVLLADPIGWNRE